MLSALAVLSALNGLENTYLTAKGQSSQEMFDRTFLDAVNPSRQAAAGMMAGDVTGLAAGKPAMQGAEDDESLLQKASVKLASLMPSSGYSIETEKDQSRRGILTPPAKPEPRRKVVRIGKGDTLSGVLQDAGLPAGNAYRIVRAVGEHYDPRYLKPGQRVAVEFQADKGVKAFDAIEVALDPIRSIRVKPADEGGYKADVHEKDIKRVVHAKRVKIKTSIYGSAALVDVPAHITAKTIRALSWDVDFQRDIRRNDVLEILYDSFVTEDGDHARNGNVLYARLISGGYELPIYRFETEDGRVDYFKPDGSSIRKTLMKTPVDGARISSGYGKRRHPVLGYNKMHKGVDFAAPTGTPIYAAGDGVIETAGRYGSFGHYVRIRHNGKLKTAYAHLHDYGPGIRAGKRVQQGDVIGYIGSTGRSTGPHLHYEVHKNGRQVNPRSLDLPTGMTLEGSQLVSFKRMVRGLDTKYASLTGGVKFADAAQ